MYDMENGDSDIVEINKTMITCIAGEFQELNLGSTLITVKVITLELEDKF